MDKENKNERRIKSLTVLYAVLTLIGAYLAVAAVLIYFFGYSQIKIIEKTAEVIPYPAAIVGTDPIRISQLTFELNSVKRFYENQDFSDMGLRVDFATPDGKKRLEIKKKNILNKLIENAVIESEARRRGIELNQADIDQEVDRKLNEYGTSDQLKSNLEKLYGWDLADFKEYIVKPDMYKEQLFAGIRKNDDSYTQAQKKISEAQTKLDNKESFSQVANDYSEGESKKDGGELGWFSAQQMLPEIAQTVMGLQKGEQSEIIQSSIGYHIIRVEDKKTENGKDMVKLQQIFVRTKPFSEYLAEFIKKRKVLIPLREFKWNENDGIVEFRDKSLQDFEKNLMNNSPDDVSVMF